ncbi:MAG: DUF3618 domain-containing protein [Jatrophihabitantaceae bacterium]
MADRDAVEIRTELELARERLASSVDQLTDRLAPQRLVDDAKSSLLAKASSPVGMAVLGGAGLLLTVLMVRNLRRSRGSR